MNLAASLVAAFMLNAAEQAPASIPPPSDLECHALPAVKPPFAFSAGEVLEYDVDAMGAQAGKLTFRVLPVKDGKLPISAMAETNTFFSKIRKVEGGGTSYLNPKTLRPVHYMEDGVESGIPKTADVRFLPNERRVRAQYTVGQKSGKSEFSYAHEALDLVGAVSLLRQVPLKKGTSVCFDAYAIRRLWRVYGKVEGKENVSLPLGDFKAWHLSGRAVRKDDFRVQREVHLWISDDGKRLPLVAVGAIDLGAVRATLKSYVRPRERAAYGQGTETLKW
jgi:hypothetical protein